jgi:hypothetical protein
VTDAERALLLFLANDLLNTCKRVAEPFGGEAILSRELTPLIGAVTMEAKAPLP